MTTDPHHLIDMELKNLREKLEQVDQEIQELLKNQNIAILRKVAFTQAQISYYEDLDDTGSLGTHLGILLQEKHRVREQIGAWEAIKKSIADRKVWLRLKTLLKEESDFRV